MNNVYSCPPEMIWSPSEIKNTKKRLCCECDKLCTDIFARTIRPSKETLNFCSKDCWDGRISRKEIKNFETFLSLE